MRRRLRLALVVVPLGLVLLATAAVAGVAWYYSSQVLTVARPVMAYDRAGSAGLPGRAGNPAGLGLAYAEVSVPGPLGPLPAWRVPGAPDRGAAADTWVVAVHGRGGSRREALRVLPALHGLGLTTLVVTYRNDEGAPPSPDGHYHLGDTEWADVDAAIGYARAAGARDVVLYGWSMGGVIAMETLDRSPQRGAVRAVVLDSPVLDWRDVLDAQGRARGLPQPLGRVAQQFAGWRAGLDLDELDQLRDAGDLRVPVLVFHSPADDFVPAGPSERLARARPDLVTYVAPPGAGHAANWDVDPAAYEQSVREFLRRTVGAR